MKTHVKPEESREGSNVKSTYKESSLITEKISMLILTIVGAIMFYTILLRAFVPEVDREEGYPGLIVRADLGVNGFLWSGVGISIEECGESHCLTNSNPRTIDEVKLDPKSMTFDDIEVLLDQILETKGVRYPSAQTFGIRIKLIGASCVFKGTIADNRIHLEGIALMDGYKTESGMSVATNYLMVGNWTITTEEMKSIFDGFQSKGFFPSIVFPTLSHEQVVAAAMFLGSRFYQQADMEIALNDGLEACFARLHQAFIDTQAGPKVFHKDCGVECVDTFADAVCENENEGTSHLCKVGALPLIKKSLPLTSAFIKSGKQRNTVVYAKMEDVPDIGGFPVTQRDSMGGQLYIKDHLRVRSYYQNIGEGKQHNSLACNYLFTGQQNVTMNAGLVQGITCVDSIHTTTFVNSSHANTSIMSVQWLAFLIVTVLSIRSIIGQVKHVSYMLGRSSLLYTIVMQVLLFLFINKHFIDMNIATAYDLMDYIELLVLAILLLNLIIARVILTRRIGYVMRSWGLLLSSTVALFFEILSLVASKGVDVKKAIGLSNPTLTYDGAAIEGCNGNSRCFILDTDKGISVSTALIIFLLCYTFILIGMYVYVVRTSETVNCEDLNKSGCVEEEILGELVAQYYQLTAEEERSSYIQQEGKKFYHRDLIMMAGFTRVGDRLIRIKDMLTVVLLLILPDLDALTFTLTIWKIAKSGENVTRSRSTRAHKYMFRGSAKLQRWVG